MKMLNDYLKAIKTNWYLIIYLLVVSTGAFATNLESLKNSADYSKLKWQILHQAINSPDQTLNGQSLVKNKDVISKLRSDYQKALAEELVIYDRFVEEQALQDYQQYLAERTFEVEYTHRCERMSGQKECADKARLEVLDKAGKQGSSIVINSNTDITTIRSEEGGEINNSSQFKEKTSMQAFANITSYDVIESYQLKGSVAHERLWFIKISVRISAKQNDYLFQQLVEKHKQRFLPYLSSNNAKNSIKTNKFEHYIETVENVKFVMVKLPKGQFIMGSEQGEYNEQPLQIKNVKSFYISETEVTKALYNQCITLKKCNGKWKDNKDLALRELDQPQSNVSWYEIQQEFIPWLSQVTGKQYRLPTEIEWEFAVRADSQSEYFYGNSVNQVCLYGNGAKSRITDEFCSDGYVKTLAEVKQFHPNKFGLYDMSGNVAEWTSTCWHRYATRKLDCSQAMVRGGSWYDQPFYLRSASRVAKNKKTRLDTLGFRLVYTD